MTAEKINEVVKTLESLDPEMGDVYEDLALLVLSFKDAVDHRVDGKVPADKLKPLLRSFVVLLRNLDKNPLGDDDDAADLIKEISDIVM